MDIVKRQQLLASDAKMTDDPLFYQAKTHIGIGLDASPADVAIAIIKQAARDVEACIAVDPSIRLTLPVPVGISDLLNEIRNSEASRG